MWSALQFTRDTGSVMGVQDLLGPPGSCWHSVISRSSRPPYSAVEFSGVRACRALSSSVRVPLTSNHPNTTHDPQCSVPEFVPHPPSAQHLCFGGVRRNRNPVVGVRAGVEVTLKGTPKIPWGQKPGAPFPLNMSAASAPAWSPQTSSPAHRGVLAQLAQGGEGLLVGSAHPPHQLSQLGTQLIPPQILLHLLLPLVPVVPHSLGGGIGCWWHWCPPSDPSQVVSSPLPQKSPFVTGTSPP